MKIFDPHIHMTSRTTDDYQDMAASGIRALIEPAFWLGQPRTRVDTFEDYFRSLLGWEPFRASQFGIKHYCTLSLNPKESNQPGLFDGVMDLIKKFMMKEGCVGIGEIGFDEGTDLEIKSFQAQLDMAREFNMPVLVHAPHRDKKKGIERSIALAREVKIDPGLVLLDHNTEETIEISLENGFWAGHSIYPNTKMTPERMTTLIQKYGTERIIINSAADWGISDPLMVPKTVDAMRKAELEEKTIEQVVWRNPIEFFSQSGRIDKDELEQLPGIDQGELFEGNSVLRGQKPFVRQSPEA